MQNLDDYGGKCQSIDRMPRKYEICSQMCEVSRMNSKCKCTPIEICDECFDELRHQDEDQDHCICKEDYNDPNCPECY